ncbi:MAG: flagellar motor protein MotB [Planctomycetota bacterium]
MAAPQPEPKLGAPPWMVSFGDMMTNVLTFFILLVSLSREQQAGLLAKGVGSFLVALRSFGLPGVLDAAEEASIFNEVRRRFGLPEEEDAARRPANILDAADVELVRASLATALTPHRELAQPAVATFAPASAELTPESRRYLDLLALTLRPTREEVLQLEGHAAEGESPEGEEDRWLAFARAQAVAEYLIREHGFLRALVEVRAWAAEIDGPGPGTRSVDARLVMPDRID